MLNTLLSKGENGETTKKAKPSLVKPPLVRQKARLLPSFSLKHFLVSFLVDRGPDLPTSIRAENNYFSQKTDINLALIVRGVIQLCRNTRNKLIKIHEPPSLIYLTNFYSLIIHFYHKMKSFCSNLLPSLVVHQPYFQPVARRVSRISSVQNVWMSEVGSFVISISDTRLARLCRLAGNANNCETCFI